jgi:hypothetical protein
MLRALVHYSATKTSLNLHGHCNVVSIRLLPRRQSLASTDFPRTTVSQQTTGAWPGAATMLQQGHLYQSMPSGNGVPHQSYDIHQSFDAGAWRCSATHTHTHNNTHTHTRFSTSHSMLVPGCKGKTTTCRISHIIFTSLSMLVPGGAPPNTHVHVVLQKQTNSHIIHKRCLEVFRHTLPNKP